MKKQPQSTTLYCFSPPVMIATCVIELGLLVWLLLRRVYSPLFGLVLVTLFCLGAFQFTEYHTCVVGPQALLVRFGMACITMLPALGLHLVAKISKRYQGVVVGYIIAGLIAACFLFVPTSYWGATCTGNYVIIQVQTLLGHTFGTYYYIFLVWALIQGFWFLKKSAKLEERRIMTWLMVGYISFMLPMGVVYTINPSVIEGVPSIMCGFAVLLALILAFRVAPLAQNLHD